MYPNSPGFSRSWELVWKCCGLDAVLGELARTIRVEKVAQVGDLAADVGARVGVSYRERPWLDPEAVVVARDVLVEVEHVIDAAEGAMGLDAHAGGVGDERVARDARRGVVCLAEPAIDDHEEPAPLDGALAGGCVHRRVAVHDVTMCRIDAELAQDGATDLGVVDEGEVGVPRLGPGGLVGEVGAFEGLDHAARERREPSAPEVPHPVERDRVVLVPGAAGETVGVVVVLPAREQLSLVVDGAEGAVGVHGDAGVEEHGVVVHEIGRAALVEEVHVTAELLGRGHGIHEAIHDVLLLGGERVGVRGVHGGEVARAHLELTPVDGADAAAGVHVLEEEAVVHLPVGVAKDGLALELEEDHRDRLLGWAHAVIGRIGAVGEEVELAKRHPVGALEDLEAVVVDVVADHGREACRGARGGAHPHDVVVAPLQVEGVVAHEPIKDEVGVRPAIEDVADEVHAVHREALDELGERADEVVGGAGVYDRVDDALVVGEASLPLVGRDVQQLVDDVGVLDGHRLAHLRARVRAREVAGESDEPHERDGVPLLRGAALVVDPTELGLGVVDERAEIGLLVLGNFKLEGRLHALADDAGAVVEDVLEGLVLAVDVRDEVLGTLGQVEDGLEVDDLGVDRLGGRELLREKLEILEALVVAAR